MAPYPVTTMLIWKFIMPYLPLRNLSRNRLHRLSRSPFKQLGTDEQLRQPRLLPQLPTAAAIRSQVPQGPEQRSTSHRRMQNRTREPDGPRGWGSRVRQCDPLNPPEEQTMNATDRKRGLPRQNPSWDPASGTCANDAPNQGARNQVQIPMIGL